jgi:hypothetical protein
MSTANALAMFNDITDEPSPVPLAPVGRRATVPPDGAHFSFDNGSKTKGVPALRVYMSMDTCNSMGLNFKDSLGYILQRDNLFVYKVDPLLWRDSEAVQNAVKAVVIKGQMTGETQCNRNRGDGGTMIPSKVFVYLRLSNEDSKALKAAMPNRCAVDEITHEIRVENMRNRRGFDPNKKLECPTALCGFRVDLNSIRPIADTKAEDDDIPNEEPVEIFGR